MECGEEVESVDTSISGRKVPSMDGFNFSLGNYHAPHVQDNPIRHTRTVFCIAGNVPNKKAKSFLPSRLSNVYNVGERPQSGVPEPRDYSPQTTPEPRILHHRQSSLHLL